ncbi:MAG TPA: DUF1127 domain-containing protein [Aliiroseovarius sp.]|nr:DUF1127 domain-containing protein [Aliiroseovarius sp.]
MAYLNTTFQTALGHGFADAISRAAYRIATAVSDWNTARRTRKALARLSDRELDDIGLSRADIANFR